MKDLPFLPEFHHKVRTGIKTATARSKSYGKPGDRLRGPGVVLVLDSVEIVQLNEVAYDWFKVEGLDSPAEFIEVWERIHPNKGYVPTQPVYFHRFHVEGRDSLHFVAGYQNQKQTTFAPEAEANR